MLEFDCPTCNTTHQDAWELLDAQVLHKIKCTHCKDSFYFRFFDCRVCETEMTQTATENTDPVLTDSVCKACAFKHPTKDEQHASETFDIFGP